MGDCERNEDRSDGLEMRHAEHKAKYIALYVVLFALIIDISPPHPSHLLQTSFGARNYRSEAGKVQDAVFAGVVCLEWHKSKITEVTRG